MEKAINVQADEADSDEGCCRMDKVMGGPLGHGKPWNENDVY